MTPLEWSVLATSVTNLVLALAIGAIYWRNHRVLRSPFTWVLALFATLLVVHNAFQVYEFFAMMGYPGFPVVLLLVEGLLQTATTIALLIAATR